MKNTALNKYFDSIMRATAIVSRPSGSKSKGGNSQQVSETHRNTFKITCEKYPGSSAENSFVTEFNGTLDDAKKYYLGHRLQFGDTESHPKDLMLKVLNVEQIYDDGDDHGEETSESLDGRLSGVAVLKPSKVEDTTQNQTLSHKLVSRLLGEVADESGHGSDTLDIDEPYTSELGVPTAASRVSRLRGLKTGDPASQLVADNIGLALHMAKAFSNIAQYSGATVDDVVGEATALLAKAASKYDPEKHAKIPFGSYAQTVIRNGLRDMYRIEKRYDNTVGTSADETPGGDGDDESFSDDMPDTSSGIPSGAQAFSEEPDPLTSDVVANKLDKSAAHKIVQKVINELPDPRMRQVLDMHSNGLSFFKIGKEIGMSDVGVLNIAQRAKTLVRQKLREMGYVDLSPTGGLIHKSEVESVLEHPYPDPDAEFSDDWDGLLAMVQRKSAIDPEHSLSSDVVHTDFDIDMIEDPEDEYADLVLDAPVEESDTAKKHQLKIAKKTLELSRVGASMLGGMDHKEAVKCLLKNGVPAQKIKNHLKNHDHSEADIEEFFGE